MSQNPSRTANYDAQELSKFSSIAQNWWNPEGEFKPLHQINPLRVQWINQQCRGLQGKTVIDVGCGGGILAESMAKMGAQVSGIDLSDESIQAAQAHARESSLEIAYEKISAEDKACAAPEQYDVVTCMEMLEHVPDPAAIIKACAQLLKPGGTLICSTISRNPKSWLLAIAAAEYVLGLVPRGTHVYQKFIRPAELAGFLRSAALTAVSMTGLSYNPISGQYFLQPDASVNYLLSARK